MRAGAPTSRTYSERYGARSPWLVERWRVLVYLVWRGLFAALRPALFMLLCLAALFFVWRGLQATPSAFLTPPPSLQLRLEHAMQEAALAQAGPDILTAWQMELDSALAPSGVGSPDILRVRSFAASLPALMGHEALALHLLRSERRPEILQAELSAMPAWRREQIISDVLDTQARRAGAGDGPSWIGQSSPSVQRRYARAEALFGRSLEAAERWFHRPEGTALNISAFPGLRAQPSSQAVLVMPDARELVLQGCALARAQGVRAPGCERAQLTLPQPDAVRAALALLLNDSAIDPAPVRLALVARAAGRLEGAWLDDLVLGPASPEREMKLLTALMPVLAEAEQYAQRPETCRTVCEAALEEFRRTAELDLAELQRWFAAYERVRRLEGALTTIRVSDVLCENGDVHALVRLAAVSEGRLLAAHALLGDSLPDIGRDEIFFQPDFLSPDFLIAWAFSSLAALMLGIVMICGHLRRRGGAPGALERLDGMASRLILGRNI